MNTDGDGAFDSDAGSGSVFHAELLGCLAGMKEAARMGLPRVCLEIGATMAKAAIEGDEYRPSALGGIITDLRPRLIGHRIGAAGFGALL